MGKEEVFTAFSTSTTRLFRTASNKKLLALKHKAICRSRSGAQHALEETIATWEKSKYDARQCNTGDVIRHKSLRPQKEVNYLLSQNESISMKLTFGWLARFQERWNLRSSRRCHGESRNADVAAVENPLPQLTSLVSEYHRDDVWNDDEWVLYYGMAPDRTISEKTMPGRKKARVHLTHLVYSNASGTEQIPLMIIMHAFAREPSEANHDRCLDSTTRIKRRLG